MARLTGFSLPLGVGRRGSLLLRLLMGLLTRFIIKRGWALTHHKATHPVTMTTYIKTGFTGPGLQVKKLSSEVTKQCF